MDSKRTSIPNDGEDHTDGGMEADKYPGVTSQGAEAAFKEVRLGKP